MINREDEKATIDYVAGLNEKYSSKKAKEHTYRSVIEIFMANIGNDTKVLNEPDRTEYKDDEGNHIAPDFLITRNDLCVGHIETKDVNVILSQAEKSKQIMRYKRLLDNFILTNYLEFRWFVNGKLIETVELCTLDKKHKKIIINEGAIDKLLNLIARFLNQKPRPLSNIKELASQMAYIAREISESVVKILDSNSPTTVIGDAKNNLPQMKNEEFADVYGLTFVCGLFNGRWCHDESKPFTRRDAVADIPKTDEFLRCIFDSIMKEAICDEPYYYLVEQMVKLMAYLNMEKIKNAASKDTGKANLGIYLFEKLMKEFNKSKQKKDGIYYTPDYIVWFIVNYVDEILKKTLHIESGLADKKISIRDISSATAGDVSTFSSKTQAKTSNRDSFS